MEYSEKHAGFTGTHFGMTRPQSKCLLNLIEAERPEFAHHGLCIGADEEFHKLCWQLNIPVIGHPPINTSRIMKYNPSSFYELKHPGDYIARDHAIVDASNVMFATPKSRKEQIRSGTWATIRYARKVHNPLYIIWPDGGFTYEAGNPERKPGLF